MNPIPTDVAVTLPVESTSAIAEDRINGPFQPTTVEHRAYIFHDALWVLTIAKGGDPSSVETARLADISTDDPWCPSAPAWFTAEVEHMRAWVEAQQHLDKRADLRIDASLDAP